MFYFCTCFDSNYLSRGLALHDALLTHAGAFKMLVLCFDDLAYEYLLCEKPCGVVPVREADFLKNNVPLQVAQNNRSRFEFFFTCTPSLILYALEKFPEADIVTYLDADLFFYASPAPLYEEMGNNSVLMLEHRLSFPIRRHIRYGRYNVGYLSFRRDQNGLDCLCWWRDRCNEWCYDRLDDDRFADQKYLDQWPRLFKGVVISQNHGAGLASWNIGGSKVRYDKRTHEVRVDGQPLIFYHFHGLKFASPWLFYDRLLPVFVVLDHATVKSVYLPYLRVFSRFIQSTQVKESVLRRAAGRTSLRGIFRYLISSYYFLLPEFLRDKSYGGKRSDEQSGRVS